MTEGIHIHFTSTDMRKAIQADVYASALIIAMMEKSGIPNPEKADFEAKMKRGLEELKNYDPDPDFDKELAGIEKEIDSFKDIDLSAMFGSN